jgi:hypothetical protein
VQGTVVDGSHSWLLADPEQFGEILTNDVTIAKAARQLEAEAAGERRAARRVQTLRHRPAREAVGRRSGRRRAGG